MDFEEAAVAMIDEDQQEAVKDLFDKLADLYIELIKKFQSVFGKEQIAAVCLHDDWGHQRGIFFSADTIREMVVPYMKKVVDFIHAEGMIAECHSCGKVDPLLPVKPLPGPWRIFSWNGHSHLWPYTHCRQFCLPMSFII